jgi:hypothetical protein
MCKNSNCRCPCSMGRSGFVIGVATDERDFWMRPFSRVLENSQRRIGSHRWRPANETLAPSFFRRHGRRAQFDEVWQAISNLIKSHASGIGPQHQIPISQSGSVHRQSNFRTFCWIRRREFRLSSGVKPQQSNPELQLPPIRERVAWLVRMQRREAAA